MRCGAGELCLKRWLSLFFLLSALWAQQTSWWGCWDRWAGFKLGAAKLDVSKVLAKWARHMDKDYLILKRASASRPSGDWNDDDYDVVANGAVVGRILKVHAAQ
jgi:hypothetical protein